MKYIFSIDNVNLLITLDTESGKYPSEIISITEPNISLENGYISIYKNGKYQRNFSFDHIGAIDSVIPTSIEDAYSKLLIIVNTINLLVSPNFKGSIIPTDTSTGTEDAVWIATQAGTYTNFGGVVVNANSRAEISRVNGVFSISQTAFDITGKVNVSDVINNLTSTETIKPLSAAQGKILNDNKINTSSIVNNLTSASIVFPLSANQGKVLNDKVVSLIAEDIKINTLLNTGRINWNDSVTYDPTTRQNVRDSIIELMMFNLSGWTDMYIARFSFNFTGVPFKLAILIRGTYNGVPNTDYLNYSITDASLVGKKVLDITYNGFKTVMSINFDTLGTSLSGYDLSLGGFKYYLNDAKKDVKGSLLTDERIDSLNINTKHWKGKTWSAYGDSITGYAGLATIGWVNFINDAHKFSKFYQRDIGGTPYIYGTNGILVAFINSDGSYNSRNSSFNYDNYTGSIPVGTTAVRGSFCSWLRIITMYPIAIKDTIDMIFIMGGTNDNLDENLPIFTLNNATDTEWANSSYYSTYGGDFNLTTLQGSVASTIMKIQAWMPNATIIIGTPLNGKTLSTGQITPLTIPAESEKSKRIMDVSRLYGIPVIDVFSKCGINVLNSNLFISDGIHPNTNGMKAIGSCISAGLNSLMKKS